MPGFSYVAVDKRGKEKRGSLEAETRERALEQLKAEGLIPVSVREQGALNKEIDFSIGKKVKPRDLSVFCRQFVSITQAGVPMKEALQMLSEQTENKWLKRAISEVLLNVEKGNTLADSMRSQPDIFPPMLVNMVEAGEQSGSLEMAFSRMAVHFEKEAKLKATIKKATIYPIILVIAAIGVIAVMLLFVIPIFIDMFADLDIEMPAITMFVMNSSKWMTSHWYVVLAIIVGVVVAYKLIYKTTQGRLTIDRIKMKMPLFGKLTVKTACSQFARTMSTLLMSGISTIDALETTSKIVNNIHYTNAMLKAREEVMKGVPLSEPLEASGIFPPMVYHMTGIGEETGNVEEMLEKMADYYDEEVEMTTQSVLAAMEPIIILFMALIIGTLVIA
ncbi:MAG: type II secretion system F family protein, partial [Ruminococcus sp.]|nr:type II secretion system F family protein [Ruminococcus sp.]